MLNVIVPLHTDYANPLARKDLAHHFDFSGIVLSQRGDHAKRFVYLDTKPSKALFSY